MLEVWGVDGSWFFSYHPCMFCGLNSGWCWVLQQASLRAELYCCPQHSSLSMGIERPHVDICSFGTCDTFGVTDECMWHFYKVAIIDGSITSECGINEDISGMEPSFTSLLCRRPPSNIIRLCGSLAGIYSSNPIEWMVRSLSLGGRQNLPFWVFHSMCVLSRAQQHGMSLHLCHPSQL